MAGTSPAMTAGLPARELAPVREARPKRWSGATIALHWTAAAIILALIALGWAMRYGGIDAARTFDLYQQHKSLGFIALVLTAARLFARAVAATPPRPFAARWERGLVAVVQGLTYLLTISAIASGWLVVSASPLPIPTRFFSLFTIPNVAAPDAALFAGASRAHQIAAWSIAGLVALHIAGALKHHFVDRDDTLARMLPRRSASFDPPPGSPRGGVDAR